MRKSQFAALMFLISGVFMAVCCFLPFKTIITTVTSGSSVQTMSDPVKFMPSLGGFFVLALSIACIVLPIIGYKNLSAIAATITAILAGGMLWYNSNAAEMGNPAEENVNAIMSYVFDGPTYSTKVETNFGLYLMVLAIVLILITGFAYTLVEED